MNTHAHELAARWRTEADAYERDGALVRADALLRRVADELDAVLRAWWTEALTIPEAAEESGYGQERLREQVREGRMENVGSPGEVRVRRCDLPRKPGPPRTRASPAESLVEAVLQGRR